MKSAKDLPSSSRAAFIPLFLKSFLTAYALCVVFHAPLDPSWYETGIDYAIASVYELLGNYDIRFLLVLIITYALYYMENRKRMAGRVLQGKSSRVLAVFLAFCLLGGQSYDVVGTSEWCFGSVVNFIKFVLALAGFSILFHTLITWFWFFLEIHDFTAGKEHFFSRYAFRKAFLIIFGAYLPFLLVSFPGNLCWDAIGQIEQVLGGAGYSTHHPLVHTLIMGGLVNGGQALFHSPEIGLFLYMILQDMLLAGALAATIAVLSERGAGIGLLRCLLLLYCITPVYSNMASTAIKDVPYAAFVTGYVICLALALERPERLNGRFVLVFLGLQIGVILFRNNGLYVILFSGLAGFFFLYRKYGWRGRIRFLAISFAGSILTAKLLLLVIAGLCGAQSGSMGEMLSVPFQQTARYLQLYGDEISQEEKEAIQGILGDTEEVAAAYNPASSDPVKARFRKDASGAELATYLKAWFQGFLKRPLCYIETFYIHVYGWFTPSVSNTIRYETEGYEAVSQGGLFPNAEKLLIFYYRFAGQFTLLGVLENVGAAVWALLILTGFQRRQKRSAAICASAPLWVSLLVCMASPGFFSHPRYAFPILFTLPFLYGFTLTGLRQNIHSEGQAVRRSGKEIGNLSPAESDEGSRA
jgi:hypothetical protein